MADTNMQDGAAAVGRALHRRDFESDPDRDRRELAEERASREPPVARSARFAGYRWTSGVDAERALGERDVEAQARAREEPRAKVKGWRR